MMFLRIFAVTAALLYSISVAGSSFEVKKQKLKLSMDYKNYVDQEENEIQTSGLRATYLMNARAEFGSRALMDFDLQTGAQTNLYRHFSAGDLPGFVWSNRVQAAFTMPFQKVYLGGSVYFRNKWLSNEKDPDAFVDIFGGIGFQQISASLNAGWRISPVWECSGSIQAGDANFVRFSESDSTWKGVSVRLNRTIREYKLYANYRNNRVEYNRPVRDPNQPNLVSNPTELQRDHFQEWGAGIEFYRSFYFSGGYSYQINDSNNPGFSFRNHRFNVLIGVEMPHEFHLQAYVILQQQSFSDEFGFLPFPVIIDENDNNTLAAGLTKTLGESNELEFGLQRYTNNSSFTQLDASKFILYAAYNFRF